MSARIRLGEGRKLPLFWTPQDHGRCLVITGNSGVGKTRYARHLLRTELSGRRVLVVTDDAGKDEYAEYPTVIDSCPEHTDDYGVIVYDAPANDSAMRRQVLGQVVTRQALLLIVSDQDRPIEDHLPRGLTVTITRFGLFGVVRQDTRWVQTEYCDTGSWYRVDPSTAGTEWFVPDNSILRSEPLTTLAAQLGVEPEAVLVQHYSSSRYDPVYESTMLDQVEQTIHASFESMSTPR